MTLTAETYGENILMVDSETGHTENVIPLDAIASWRTLLGLGSDVEAVAAIMQAQDPGVLDPETGRNAWTSAYEQCEHDRANDLNQSGLAAMRRAKTLAGGLASDGRRLTRSLLGLPPGDTRALRLLSTDDEPPATTIPLPDGVDATQLESVLSEASTVVRINSARDRFESDLLPKRK